MFSFSVTKVIFREKYFFLQELIMKYVFINICLRTKLICFIPQPLEPTTKGEISSKLNCQKLGNLLI